MHREPLDEAVVVLNLAESDGNERAYELKDNDHADEADGREVYVNVAQLATAYAFGHGFAQHTVIGRGILGNNFHDVLAAGQHLARQDACKMRVAEKITGIGFDEACQPLFESGGATDGFGNQPAHSRSGVFDDGAIEALFVAEVVMNHRAVDARRGGDLANADAGKAVLGKQLFRRRQYLRPRLRVIGFRSRHSTLELIKRLIKE